VPQAEGGKPRPGGGVLCKISHGVLCKNDEDIEFSLLDVELNCT
jgi:hypothetical protein